MLVVKILYGLLWALVNFLDFFLTSYILYEILEEPNIRDNDSSNLNHITIDGNNIPNNLRSPPSTLRVEIPSILNNIYV